MDFPAIAIHSGLLALLLFSCGSKEASWEVCEARTRHDSYQAFRLSQKPDNIFRGMELEFARTASGMRAYLNIFSLKFSQSQEDPCKTEVIFLSGKEEIRFLADRLKGDQRLLIPQEAQSYLIEKLSEKQPVSIIAGRFSVEIAPAEFSSYIPKLLDSGLYQSS